MKSAQRVHLVTYATGRFRLAAPLLARSARRFGISTTVYGPNSPPVVELRSRHPDLMGARRGAGYWRWKPTIILDAFGNAGEGDIVVYCDAAAVFQADPWPLLGLSERYPIMLFEDDHAMAELTKRDCFVALDADTPEHWRMRQLWAGFQIFRVGRQALAFVEAVDEVFENAHLLDDSPNQYGLPNLDGFVEHRHDQSVLSLVARQHDLPVFPDPSQWGPRAAQPARAGTDGWTRPEAPYGQILYLHRTMYLRWLVSMIRNRSGAATEQASA